MTLINWGSESPEQLAVRRRLEEQAVYEQAARMAQAKQRAGQSVAGSGGDPLTGLYGVGADGLIYSLNRSEENWEYNYTPVPDITQLALNTDDGFLYAVVDFAGTVYFIRVDRQTREVTFIENNISDYVSKGASSLYYEGNGSFIYLDNFYKSSVSSIIRVTLDELSPETATATEVSEVDSEVAGFLLRNLFLYDGTPWAIAILGDDLIVGPFDINLGGFEYYNLILPSPQEPNVLGILGIFSTVQHNGKIYVDAVWDAGEDAQLGLFTMDTQNGGAVAPYYLKFVKDLLIGEGEVQVLSIASF